MSKINFHVCKEIVETVKDTLDAHLIVLEENHDKADEAVNYWTCKTHESVDHETREKYRKKLRCHELKAMKAQKREILCSTVVNLLRSVISAITDLEDFEREEFDNE